MLREAYLGCGKDDSQMENHTSVKMSSFTECLLFSLLSIVEL